jgi:dolichol-phosphate mannosyltransferase
MEPSAPLVVVPTYRERENLPHLTERLWKAVPDGHLVLVDDCSNDGTPEWVKEQPDFNKRLHLIARPGKLGLGSAYRDGFTWALHFHKKSPVQAIVQLDADLSHDPASIPNLLQAIREGADVAVGTRYALGGGIERWRSDRLALSRFAGVYVRGFTGMPLSDPTGGFKAYRPEALEQINLAQVHSEGYAFQIEMNWLAWRAGLKVSEVPIIFGGREMGMSKISGKIVREAVWRVPWLAIRGLTSNRKQPKL